MRCPRCGNDNPDDNRFCGMCGATLLAPPPPPAHSVPDTQTGRAASAGASVPAHPAPPAVRPQAPEAPRRAAPDEFPVISGPSFLGLNDPAPPKRASLSIDPGSTPRSSGNLDYLLEDDEEPRHGGAGKYILILVALALAVGFGYLHWKNRGFAWLTPGASKPAATAQTPESTDTTPPAPASPSTTPEAQPPAAPPAQTTATTQPSGTPSQALPTTQQPGATPESSTEKPSVPPAEEENAPAAPATDTVPGATPASASAANNATSAPAKPHDDTSAESHQPPAPGPKPEKPKLNQEDSAPAKPPAAVKPAKPVDPVAEAQRYLYGKGVAQNCDRGLRILKPAANAANPKAMVEMGALYAAGLCTPHDLPTAYRWFALALRKDPSNQPIQTDLEKLWGEMTQAERQLAIKMTQ